ncbi:hypothetical protein HK102_012262 [Quaeritorhiza haematococci]|nr:hypothetical protein HK102_012262 [Quaeritorhiza haematococci]
MILQLLPFSFTTPKPTQKVCFTSGTVLVFTLEGNKTDVLRKNLEEKPDVPITVTKKLKGAQAQQGQGSSSGGAAGQSTQEHIMRFASLNVLEETVDLDLEKIICMYLYVWKWWA